MTWLVLSVGCIHCGLRTEVVGAYAVKEAAGRASNAAQRNYEREWQEGKWKGQREFIVRELPEIDTTGVVYEYKTL